MRPIQSVAFIFATFATPFVGFQYRIGGLALYDIANVFLWFSLLLYPKTLQSVPRELIKRVSLMLCVVLLFGGIATLVGVNMFGIKPAFISLFRIIAGMAFYVGIWLILNNNPSLVKKLLWPITIISLYQGYLVLMNTNGLSRYLGTFNDPNYFGTYEAMLFMIILSVAINQKVFNIKTVSLYFLALLVALSILLSFSRGAYLSALFGIFFVLVASFYKKPMKLIAMMLVVTVVIMGGLQVIYHQPTFSKWTKRLSIERTVSGGGSGRLDIWKRAIHAGENNLIGYGWGSEVQVLRKVGHNIFVESGIQFGVIGIIGMVMFMFWAFKDVVAIFKKYKIPLFIGFGGAIVVMLVGSLTLDVLFYRQFWYVLALGAAIANVDKGQHQNVVQEI